MFNLFRVIVDRIKAVFATAAALELEREFLLGEAERRADRYDAEGLTTVAARLRQMAEATSVEKPAASVLPALTHLQGEAQAVNRVPALPEPAGNGERLSVSTNGKKKGR